MEFGRDKCKLPIFSRPGKLHSVEALPENEPEVLTFYDHPVNQVKDPYIHIGVPQSPRHQSKNAVDYRISKGQNISYQLQGSTQNSLCGVSPLSNRKMFISYHQPSYIYGLDTMHINITDMARLETKYRKVLKNMLSMPDCVSSPMVYLTIGVLPATAQRDLEIMGLLGQLSMCDNDDQNVRNTIKHNLAFFDVQFAGWSGVARKTASVYGLPDPLLYMGHPWRPDRWRSHSRSVITDYWDRKLRDEAEQKPSTKFADLECLSTSTPMRIWQQAGLDSTAVKEATPCSWMYCGTYFTRQLLYKMKKTKSPLCACDDNISEDLSHFLLHCKLYQSVRQQYLPKYLEMNSKLVEIFNSEDLMLISILDPISSKLPNQVSSSWDSIKNVYELSRKFTYRMHLKREKVYSDLDIMT